MVGVLGGCSSNHTSDQAEYLMWLNDPDHGLIQMRTVNGLRIAVKYLPPELRAYQELRVAGSPEDRAKVLERCGKSVAVLLSIAPDSSQMRGQTIDPQATIQQGQMLQADIQEHLTVRAGGTTYRPVVTALDNDAGMGGKISITAVYADDVEHGPLLGAGHYDIAFDDEIFGTGITHFTFDRKAIDARLLLDF